MVAEAVHDADSDIDAGDVCGGDVGNGEELLVTATAGCQLLRVALTASVNTQERVAMFVEVRVCQ